MAYSKQTWDTTSYVNPTRLNHMEDGIYNASIKADTIGNTSDLPSPSRTVAQNISDINNNLTQLSADSGWVTISTTKTRPIYIRKIGKLCEFMYWTDEALTANEVIATLPAQYRPNMSGFYPQLFSIAGKFSTQGGSLQVGANGEIKSLENKTSGGWIIFHDMYFTA